jgi:putative transposon-encoded protein|tara:strand:+ start:88 stop:246 length:159 start_codon:yes stop_codon:yes gene_type:complete
MRRIELTKKTTFSIEGIAGFFKKKVTPFGTGAKIDCPKEYLNKTVYVVIAEK